MTHPYGPDRYEAEAREDAERAEELDEAQAPSWEEYKARLDDIVGGYLDYAAHEKFLMGRTPTEFLEWCQTCEREVRENERCPACGDGA